MGEMTIEDYKESIDIIMKDRDKRVLNERKLQSENKRLRDAIDGLIKKYDKMRLLHSQAKITFIISNLRKILEGVNEHIPTKER